MAQTNGLYKNVTLTDNAPTGTISLTVTNPGGADNIAVALDTGNSSNALVGVQGMRIDTPKFHIWVTYETPNLNGATAVLTA